MRFLLFPLLFLTVATSHSADSIMENGDLETGGLGSNNSWTAGKGVTIEEENGNHFLHLEAVEPNVQIQSYRLVKIPDGVKKLKVSFKVRYENITPGAENWHTGRLIMHFKDAGGGMLKPDPKPFAFKDKSDGWVEKEVELDVPEGSVALEFMPALFQVGTGTLDIDDVVITPAS